MSLRDRFSEELRYLHELGNDFAKDNPQLARLLGKGASDPDVERLMEAFAFLTAKLRLKLEDDLPELTHPMLQLLWPNYLRPLPSATIIKFSGEAIPQPVTAHPKGVAAVLETGRRRGLRVPHLHSGQHSSVRDRHGGSHPDIRQFCDLHRPSITGRAAVEQPGLYQPRLLPQRRYSYRPHALPVGFPIPQACQRDHQ